MNADPVVMEHFPSTLTREESDAFVDRMQARWHAHGYGLWAVEVGGAFAGYTGHQDALFEASFTPTVEIGWRFASAYWGRGLALEAATAALDHWFGTLGRDAIRSWTAVLNERSWRLMERLGMTRDGEFDYPTLPAGHRLRRHVLYGLTAQEWATRRPRPGAPPGSPAPSS